MRRSVSRHHDAARPEASRERLDLIPLLDEVELELGEGELLQEVRPMQLQPRVLRA
jgi:hypothetical protein